MILVAASIHILLVAGFSLLLMSAEGMFGNRADSALAAAMLVQSVYPWLIFPLAAGTSVYCASKTYRRSLAAFVASLASVAASLIALGASTAMELGSAVVATLIASASSIIFMAIVVSRPLRPISSGPITHH